MSNHLESILDHKFEDQSNLHRALFRKDNITNKPGTRTRLDFPSRDMIMQIGDQTALETLGDAVIHVYILENRIENGAKSREDMHIQKMDYGKNVTLTKVAKKIRLQDFVYWSENEENTKIWEKEGSRVLADCFEALIGAIYLDGGTKSVRKTLDTLKFLELYRETPILSELEEKVHMCTFCHQTDLDEVMSRHPVYSFGDTRGKEILVVGINPSTREFENKYLSDSDDPSERHQSQLTYFQRDYYDFFKKIEAFFKGQVQEKIGWVQSPWEKVGFIDLVKCPSRIGKSQWGGLKSKQKRLLIQNCQNHLINQLEQLKPKIIIPYGADVCKWFSKRYNVHYKPFSNRTVNASGKEIRMLFLYQKQGPYDIAIIEKVRDELYQMI